MKISEKSIKCGATANRIDRDDRQCHQDRVGVVLLDGLVERTAGGRLVVNVAADELDAVADSFEDQDHLVVADRVARLGESASDGDGYEQRLVELIGTDLAVKVVAGLVEREQPVDFFGPG